MSELPRDLADGRWLKQVPRRDLNLIHHALRMLATHPMTTEQHQILELADACWDESVARTEAGE
jgi:hypothetical protein